MRVDTINEKGVPAEGMVKWQRQGTKSWLAILKERFPEVVIFGVSWLEEEGCWEYIQVYLSRDLNPAKDREIEKFLRESILQPANFKCKEVKFVRR